MRLPFRFGCAALAALLLMTGCYAVTLDRDLNLTPEMFARRQMQTRRLDTADKEKTMRAIIATLQDLGFMLDRADSTLGVVTASKARADSMQMQVYASLRITVTVRPRGERQLLVRASAEYQRSPVTEAKPYQNFFNSLEKAMSPEAHQVDSPRLTGQQADGSAFACEQEACEERKSRSEEERTRSSTFHSALHNFPAS